MTDLDYIADGCYVFGCGGGGSPTPGNLQLREMIRSGYRMRCVDQSALKEDAVIYRDGYTLRVIFSDGSITTGQRCSIYNIQYTKFQTTMFFHKPIKSL
jgi:hypothetical protein